MRGLKKVLHCTVYTVYFCVMTASVPAFAQDIDSRLSRLENELSTLNRAVFKGEAPPPSAHAYTAAGGASSSADIEVRLSQIEREMARLTGQVEQQDYERRRLQSALDKVQADLDVLMQRNVTAPSAASANTSTLIVPAESSVAPVQPQAQVQPRSSHILGTLTVPAAGGETLSSDDVSAGTTTALAPAVDDASASYSRAFSLLQTSRFAEAEAAFKDFLTRYPDHRLAGNAQYWLGETYYVRHDYKQAARYFAEGYQQYPEGNKAPDNLLKLGLSLAGMGKKEEACITFEQLLKTHANGGNPILDRTKREQNRLGCL